MIYVIEPETAPVFKIGYSATDEGVLKRLTALQTGNHERLKVLFVRPGTREQEGKLHRLLWSLGLQACGEWFRYSTTAREAVEKIRSKGVEAGARFLTSCPGHAWERIGQGYSEVAARHIELKEKQKQKGSHG